MDANDDIYSKATHFNCFTCIWFLDKKNPIPAIVTCTGPGLPEKHPSAVKSRVKTSGGLNTMGQNNLWCCPWDHWIRPSVYYRLIPEFKQSLHKRKLGFCWYVTQTEIRPFQHLTSEKVIWRCNSLSRVIIHNSFTIFLCLSFDLRQLDGLFYYTCIEECLFRNYFSLLCVLCVVRSMCI